MPFQHRWLTHIRTHIIRLLLSLFKLKTILNAKHRFHSIPFDSIRFDSHCIPIGVGTRLCLCAILRVCIFQNQRSSFSFSHSSLCVFSNRSSSFLYFLWTKVITTTATKCCAIWLYYCCCCGCFSHCQCVRKKTIWMHKSARIQLLYLRINSNRWEWLFLFSLSLIYFVGRVCECVLAPARLLIELIAFFWLNSQRSFHASHLSLYFRTHTEYMLFGLK